MRLARMSALLLPLLAVQLARAEEDYISAAELAPMGLAKSWQLRVPLSPGQTVADAYLVDDQVYVTTLDGYVFAIHAPSGALRWANQVTRGGYRLTRPCHIRERTVFATVPRIAQFDRVYGTALRATELRFPAGSPPVSDDVTIFLGGIDGRIYDFKANFDYPIWKATIGGEIVSRPVMLDIAIYIASDAGYVMGGRRDNRRLLWKSIQMGPITADLMADDNGVYVASKDGSLYLLEPGNGAPRWRARLNSPLLDPPLLTPKQVYQFSDADGVAAIDTGGIDVKERIHWKVPEARAALTVEGDSVYLWSRDQSILRVRASDGAVQETAEAPGFTLFMPTSDETAVYLADASGRVFCARSKNAPLPKAKDVRAAMTHVTAPAATQPGSQPAEAAPPKTDLLGARQNGATVGGKSKVTRELLEGNGTPKP